MAKSNWLIAILVAALLPWCRVLCGAAPVAIAHDHCAAHAAGHAGSHVQAHAPAPLSAGLDCADDLQSISTTAYSSLDSLIKQLPLSLAVGIALTIAFALIHYPSPASFRTRSASGPPLRRHLLFCVIRD